MVIKIIKTGEIVKDVQVCEKDSFGEARAYIDSEGFIYRAGDVEEIELLTEQKVYDYYQSRSQTAGDRAEQLAWMFIVILCAQLIGGSHFREPYIVAAGGIGYVLLSSLQALYQAFTAWLLKKRIRRGMEYQDYPSWIGGGAWGFYWAKMAVISATSIYAVYHFMKLL